MPTVYGGAGSPEYNTRETDHVNSVRTFVLQGMYWARSETDGDVPDVS
jgi:hypothetical protein